MNRRSRWSSFVQGLLAGVPLCLLGLSPAQGAAPAPPSSSFDPAALVPYFATGSAAEAARRFRAGDRGAQKLLLSYLKENPREKDLHQARFLLGLSYLRQRPEATSDKERGDALRAQGLEAAKHFDRLAGKYVLLDSYHRLYAARGYLLGDRPGEALLRAQEVPADSPLSCEARFVRGEALYRLARREGQEALKAPLPKAAQKFAEEAAAEYAGYLSACEGRHRFESRAKLAEVRGTLGQKDEALKQWRSLYLEAPTESYGALAERALSRAGDAAGHFTPEELLSRAQVLFDNMRNPESETAYRDILKSLPPAPAAADSAHVGELRCQAQFQLAQSIFKQRQRPRASSFYDDAVPLCEAAKNDELHMKSLYQSARCHGSKGELQEAADVFARAEAAHPTHSYADDSRLRQAEMYADLSDKLKKNGPEKTCNQKTCPDYEGKITSLLSELPDRFPTGDQRSEALFRLAFRAYRARDFMKAKGYLLDSQKKVARESGWDQEGRTLYWLGRLADLSGGNDAIGYYRRAATEYPLSYYSLVSFNRLREKDPKEFARLIDELNREPPATAAPPGAAGAGQDADAGWHWKARDLFTKPAFLRGVELARLHLGPEARQELLFAGIKTPAGKGQKIADPDEEELLWLAAVLYDRAGEWALSHWIPRHTLTGYQRHYPVGGYRKQWLLSYPRGYEELLTEAAQKDGQPEGLQFAIVREESAFDPQNESFANAIGLTQMIPPTAKRFSEGLPTTREALRDPAINVAIGARFLGFLWSTMQKNPPLTIAGYNAGEGAVFRWLKDHGDLDLDAWVEAIPYDETRGYTKRVLSSFLTYNWLMPDKAGGKGDLLSRIPVVPLRAPDLPQARKAVAKPGDESDPHRK